MSGRSGVCIANVRAQAVMLCARADDFDPSEYAEAIGRAFPMALCSSSGSNAADDDGFRNTLNSQRSRLLAPVELTFSASGASEAKASLITDLLRPLVDAHERQRFVDSFAVECKAFETRHCASVRLYDYEAMLRANGGTLGDPSTVGAALAAAQAGGAGAGAAAAAAAAAVAEQELGGVRRKVFEPSASAAAVGENDDDGDEGDEEGEDEDEEEDEEEDDFDDLPMTQAPDKSPKRSSASAAKSKSKAKAKAKIVPVVVVIDDGEGDENVRRRKRPEASAAQRRRFDADRRVVPTGNRRLDERHSSATIATWESPPAEGGAASASAAAAAAAAPPRGSSRKKRKATFAAMGGGGSAKRGVPSAGPKRNFSVSNDDNVASELSADDIEDDDEEDEDEDEEGHGGAGGAGRSSSSARRKQKARPRVSQKARETHNAIQYVRRRREVAEVRKRKGGRKSRARVPFSQEERDSIIEGVQKYKSSNRKWADILAGAFLPSLLASSLSLFIYFALCGTL